MVINKAYILVKDKKSNSIIEEIIRSTFENVDVTIENNVFSVSVLFRDGNGKFFHLIFLRVVILKVRDFSKSDREAHG